MGEQVLAWNLGVTSRASERLSIMADYVGERRDGQIQNGVMLGLGVPVLKGTRPRRYPVSPGPSHQGRCCGMVGREFPPGPPMQIAVFSARPYDRRFLDEANQRDAAGQ
ncbi:hypothetical protein, partial [Acinetobacter baumannii]|uniref:hypothetical protein n=1 Tax=Acinetobacter baumannii TaxID=470 RepID=UPI0011360F7B